MSATATKSAKAQPKQTNGHAKAKAEPQTYADIIKVTSAAVDERQRLAIGRGGAKIAPRRFHLMPEDVERLKAEYAKGDKCPNPQNKGAYYGFIAALKALGLNKPHSYGSVKAKMREIMSGEGEKGETLWDRFASHKGDSPNALDLDGRIRQNAEVLQRLGGFTPYGLKLLQVGTLILKSKGVVVDILKGKTGDLSYRLNTNSAEPLNETRKRHAPAEPQKAEPKANKSPEPKAKSNGKAKSEKGGK